jgi:fimbrial chaperone protein
MKVGGALRSCAVMAPAWTAAALAATSGLAQPAPAVRVAPVSVELAAGQKATTLTLENEGDTPTIFQIRPFAWSQPGGADQLDPTDDLVASPPFATIAPHGKQVVRLVLHRGAEEAETTYRVLLDQTPPPAGPGAGVRIALRLSIPVFALPARRIAADLQWRIDEAGGEAWLVAVNRGGRHDAVRDLKLASADGRPLRLETGGVSPYVLGGATRRWRIDAKDFAAAPQGAARLTAATPTGAIDQAVPLAHVRP